VFAIDTLRAFAIHIFTASGAALALIALILASEQQWAAMFFCLGFAVLIDGLDGPLARMFRVRELLPRWSGETLDLVVDFTSYVFVPAYAIATGELLPEMLSVVFGIVIVVTGALYFADREMKTGDNYFKGFPATWNVAAFYLFLYEPPPWIAAAIVLVLAGLSFAPIKFVHPLRVQNLRPLTIALLVLWGLLAFNAVISNLAPGLFTSVGLGLIALYFLGAGLLPQRVAGP
jgi:phosphatidylcholine synthase